MYRLEVLVSGGGLALEVFKLLEREVVFSRGRLRVEGGLIVAEAEDAASLRSLLHTIFRSLYVIEHVERL